MAQNMRGEDTSKNKAKQEIDKSVTDATSVSSGGKRTLSPQTMMMKDAMLEAQKKNKMGHKATGISKDLKTVYFTDPNKGEYHITPDGRQVFVSKPSLVGQTDQYIIKR